MRLARFAALGFMLVATPALAETGHLFGNSTCRERVACADDIQPSSAANYAMEGSACISQSFGYTNPDGFFDKYAGLDGNNCLTPVVGSIPKGVGAQLIGTCCVVKNVTTNSCNFHCTLVTP